MRAVKHRLLYWILALTLLCALPAFASENIALDDIGLRYAPVEGESCMTVTGDITGDKLPESLGMGEDEMINQMKGAGAYLISEMPDGRHVRLLIYDIPEDISADSVWDMNEAQKAEALEYIIGFFASKDGKWLDDGSGYALITNTFGAFNARAPIVVMNEMRLATPYLGKLLVLETDIVGREPSDSDEVLLKDAAKRLLRLGARSKPTGGEPEAPAAMAGPLAEITVLNDELPLSLDPICADYPSTNMVLSGTTQKGTPMRYYIDDNPSSRFYSSEDGSFRVTSPSLVNGKDNVIRLLVLDDNKRGEVTFTLHVDRKPVPVNLSLQMGCVEGEELLVKGKTLAGAKVSLTKRAGKTAVTQEKDGSFTVDVKLPNLGENKLSLTISYKGYQDNIVPLSYVRLPESQEDWDKLLGSLPKIDYAQLSQSPTDFAGDMLLIEGTIKSLRYDKGKAYCVIQSAGGESYAAHVENLYSLNEGDEKRMLALASGENTALFENSMPLINELSILD